MGTRTHHTRVARPFWKLWLIGIAKIVGGVGGGTAVLVGGAWLFRTYPLVGNVVGVLIIIVAIGLAGLFAAPQR
jgi:hypothetical protein